MDRGDALFVEVFLFIEVHSADLGKYQNVAGFLVRLFLFVAVRELQIRCLLQPL